MRERFLAVSDCTDSAAPMIQSGFLHEEVLKASVILSFGAVLVIDYFALAYFW